MPCNGTLTDPTGRKDGHYFLTMEIIMKSGFSFLFLLFGPLVPLFRGEFSLFFKTFALAVVTLGLSNFYFMFKYNEKRIEYYKQKPNTTT